MWYLAAVVHVLRGAREEGLGGGGYARVVKGLERGTRGWGSNPDSVRQIKKVCNVKTKTKNKTKTKQKKIIQIE